MSKSREEVLQRLAEGDIEGFYYAPEEVYVDREVLLAAVAVEGEALAYAMGPLTSDREIVLLAVSSCGDSLQHASKELRNDREIAMAAVSNDGCALDYVTEELKHDTEIVMAAIAQSGWALEFAGEEFRNDRSVVLAAIAEDPQALRKASEDILKDDSFAAEARQSMYFFRITAMSGRECMLASDDEDDLELADGIRSLLLMKSCAQLGLSFTGYETLVHSTDIVPEHACICQWPGAPKRGAITDYQLVASYKASAMGGAMSNRSFRN